jgi:hypothetical protein
MPAPHLCAVPRVPPRPSVIVDLTRGQRMSIPFTMAEVEAAYDRPGLIPHAITCAMWVAAWARAEDCPLTLRGGWLEPYCRYTPSDDLWCAVLPSMGDLVGALGFGIPIMLDQHKLAWAASWPACWERS